MRGTTAFPFVVSASLLTACLSQPARADGACGEALLPARGLLAVAQRARQPSKSAVEKARAAWAAVPAACQGGAWYALGAAILRNPGPGARQPLAEGKRSFAAPRDALEAGLKAAPQDPELLAYVAYLGRVQPEASPPLPKDACARLKDGDPAMRDYVCGVQALADRRGAEAARLFGGLHLPTIPGHRRAAGPRREGRRQGRRQGAGAGAAARLRPLLPAGAVAHAGEVAHAGRLPRRAERAHSPRCALRYFDGSSWPTQLLTCREQSMRASMSTPVRTPMPSSM